MQPQPHSSSRFLILDSAGSRKEQEDAAVCLYNAKTEAALLVVCDGVGGSSDGGAASEIATQQARIFWTKRQEVLDNPLEDMALLCRQAHDQIREEGQRLNTSPRTTLVALYLDGKRAYWAHSGDSRLYHFRAGRLLTRTRDHSVVEILVRQGAVQEEEMGLHADQGRLLQSLGGAEYKPPAQASAEITVDDAFLLCTDGFWERTTADEMAELLYAPRVKTEALLRQALQRASRRNGSQGDNLTVAIVLPLREGPPKGRFPSVRNLLLVLLLAACLVGIGLFLAQGGLFR